jgi:CheY-like chemotaxis protein
MAKTLLLADGSVTIQRVVDLTFAHEDIRVVSVSDGSRAVKWLDSERPDIVLVDVDLPEVDGYGLVTHLKKSKKLSTVPVLMLAGAFEPVDQDKARSLGCDGIIVKPFEPQHLVARVKELLAENGSGKSAPARDGGQSKAPAFTGPADSPSLAILRAGAGRAAESEMKSPKLEPVASRADVTGPTAFLRPGPHDAATPVAQERLELPTRPVWDAAAHGPMHGSVPGAPAQTLPLAAPAGPAKVSLASAFSALLAAEQSTAQPAAPAAMPVQVITEASVEDAVRRVLVRMTDELVRRIVVDTAERLIREEIQKIKDNPE